VRPRRPASPVSVDARGLHAAPWPGLIDNGGMDASQQTSVVEQWLAAGDHGDVDAFDALLHPDAVVHAPRGLSTTDREHEKQVWRDALAAMPDLRHEVQEVLKQGDTEMARVVVTGTMAAAFAGVDGTGQSFRMDQAVICHLRDGKIAEAWEIADVSAIVEPSS